MTGINIGLNPSMGCFLIGILFSLIFYGVTCAQVLFYIWEYPQDRWYMKALVAFLCALDTGSTIVDIMVIWDYLVTGHANLVNLTILASPFLAEYAISAVTVLLVQSYYMHSVWRLLSKRWYQVPLTITMLMFALCSCACSLASVYLGNFDRAIPGIFVKTKIPAALQTVSASVTDMYITASLTLILRGERTGFKHTETLVRKLTVYAINRGLVTTVLQFGQFITYVSLPDTVMVWAIFHFPGSKAYVNSLLAILNARHYLRENTGRANMTDGISAQEIPLDTLGQAQPKKSWFRTNRATQVESTGHAVITLTTEIIRDDSDPIPLEKPRRGRSKTAQFY